MQRDDEKAQFLSEDEIVRDYIDSIKRNPETLEQWMSASRDDLIMFHWGAGQWIRNHYKLWHPDNPHTQGYRNGPELDVGASDRPRLGGAPPRSGSSLRLSAQLTVNGMSICSSMMIRAATVIALISLACCACERQQSKEEAEKAEHDKSEALIFSNQDNSSLEIEKRLAHRISLRGNTIVLIDPDGVDVIGMTASNPWTISCGPAGITVSFGSAATSEDNCAETTNLELTSAWLKQEQCEWLVPMVSEKLQAIIRH